MAALPVLRIESSGDLAVRAATLKAGHRVSVADAWIAAPAQEHGAILIHKDPEFEQIDSIVQLLSLPYKA